jgi:transcriptional regulator with XRE-family HTH domain
VSEFRIGANQPPRGPLKLRLRELREAAGLTQYQLADAVGCHVMTIVRLEKGEGRPNAATLGQLASALGVTPAELVATP